MYDGCGTIIEEWNMSGIFPENVDFGDLDYQDSGIMEVTLTLQYDHVQFTGGCQPEPSGSCTGC